jgi:hypothetical protein
LPKIAVIGAPLGPEANGAERRSALGEESRASAGLIAVDPEKVDRRLADRRLIPTSSGEIHRERPHVFPTSPLRDDVAQPLQTPPLSGSPPVCHNHRTAPGFRHVVHDQDWLRYFRSQAREADIGIGMDRHHRTLTEDRWHAMR